MPKDYYEILGVRRDADAAEIKQAYRRLSKEYHPDKRKGDRESEEKYKQINRAYEVLSNPKKRELYDQFGTEEVPGGAGFGPFEWERGQPFGHGFEGFEGFGEFGDLFETFFGGRRGARREGEKQGQEIRLSLMITLAEAFMGTQRTIRLKKPLVCGDCSGMGRAAGSPLVNCSHCRGTGQVTKTARSFFGVMQQTSLCDICSGSGKVPETPCRSCSGEGRIQGSEEVSIAIPAGIADGQTLRLRGKGGAGRQGGVSGDLSIRVEIQPDPRFTRDGEDLHTAVTIPVVDAVLGKELPLETLGGRVTIHIPPGTQPRQVLRIRGKGMPVLHGRGTGDLYVTVQVAVPEHLGRRERKLWEELRG
jgi:molecular chaperone DnaJ